MNKTLVKAGIKQKVTNSFAAFKNIDGVTWRPRIYLPNYAELKKSGKVGNKAINSIRHFFNYAGEEKVTAYKTFRADKTNTAIIKAFSAIEEIGATNEVLIIELSEELLLEPSTNNDAYKANAGIKTMGTPVNATME